MSARKLIAAAIAAGFLGAAALPAAAQTTDAPVRKSEPIYGYRLMTDPERNEYREKMRNARSAAERQSIRDGQRKLMETRAKERGVTLPEPRGPGGPRAGGPGAGKGQGYGPGSKGKGKGPGSGYGPGKGKGAGYGPGGNGPGAGKGPGPRR
ncbi:MAG: hypothetical protein HYY78_17945 [Betaproteobacteria bacterium]|nr:hypothetical protein [Betaproteobacteria bacterium]